MRTRTPDGFPSSAFERAEQDWSARDERDAGLRTDGGPTVTVLTNWPGCPITIDQAGSAQIQLKPVTALAIGYAVLRAINEGQVVDPRVSLHSNGVGEYVAIHVEQARQTYYTGKARELAVELIRVASEIINKHTI